MRCTVGLFPTFIAVYGLLYAAFGLQSPYLPALLRERGFPAAQLGVVLAASTAIRVFAGPALGHTADRLQRHTLVLCGCSLAAAIAGLGYLTMRPFLPLLLAALAQAAMLAPLVPISDALATTAAQRTGRFDYGWIRAAGSAAFILGATLGGWVVARAGLTALPWLAGIVVTGGGVVSLLLPPLGAAWRGPARSGARDLPVLLRLSVYRRMLIVAAMVEGSHALHDSFAVIRWRDAGMDARVVGLLWSESVLAEVAVFLLAGPWLLRRIAPAGACSLAAAAGVLRWTVAAFTTAPVVLALIQPLHGLTFALLHLACMRLIVRVVPARLAATAQSIYGTLSVGAATALLTLVSGLLYQRMDGRSFLVMAVLCLLALPLCRGLRVEARAE
jgi:MFS transporter, PPP family, 3-phenylpropionic acid transporter